ncbi:hypothetical protein Tco_0246514 [Tanacetum coccineum]
MDITLTLSSITSLDVQFDTPSPLPPIFGHPIPWNLLEAHRDSCPSSNLVDDDSSTSDSEDEEYAMAVRNFKKFFKRRGRFIIPKDKGDIRDQLPACLAHMLYCVVAEEQYNLAYFFVKRIQCARYTPTANLPYGMFLTRLYRHVMETYPHLDNGIYDIVDRVMRPLALKQTRRPRSDRGKARHSISSSSSHHQGTSSHQHDVDDDDV